MSRLITKSASLAQTFQNCGFLSVIPAHLGVKKPKFGAQRRLMSAGVVQSPLGPCKKIPNDNLVEYIYKNNEKWIEEPATVSKTVLSCQFLNSLWWEFWELSQHMQYIQ